MTMTAMRSETLARPRFEGSNICTWIGFKHVMYLIEEAVLDHLRQGGLVPRHLYEEYGIGIEIVDSDVRISSALHMDDLVRTEVVPQDQADTGELVFRTASFVQRPDPAAEVKAASATVRVVFRREPDGPEPPAGIAQYTVNEIDRRVPGVPSPASAAGRGMVSEPADVLAGNGNAFAWRWRIPYFYCHFSRRMQHSGYLRLMEEVVDLFLAERGISIRTMLDGQSWIPVVPHARVSVLGEALMEEEMHTVFTVEEVFKDLTYTARMDCYVRRGGQLLQTATGRITHGYAVIVDRRDWRLVPFDERTLTALRG
jgi:acyl-CoA thioesterase FadM